MKSTAILLLLGVFTLHGCVYEEGPTLSFRSRKERLVNLWRIDVVDDSHTNITNTWLQSPTNFKAIDFFKDGTTTFYYDINFNTKLTGTWAFADKDKNVAITLNVPNVGPKIYIFEILRLEENELWLYDNKGDSDEGTYIIYKF